MHSHPVIPIFIIAHNVKSAAKQSALLANLYNACPAWLAAAHQRLDAAVLDAYGWPHDLSDEELLARLLALNLERAEG
ncbi:MAG TPA: hypothetical protein GYA08_22865 [Chloroflexi bacterium]|nr:hypothetical protein [Chloroflexota bacterium]